MAKPSRRPGTQHVALYVRVSTEEQARDNTSVENQVDKGLAFARDQGLDRVCVYADPGYSGASDQRPAFQLLLDAARQGQVSQVLVYRQDRFSRSPRHLYNAISVLEGAGCTFTSVTEPFVDTSTPMGRQFIHTLAGFAQWELDTFRERARDGKLKVVEQRRHPGGKPPFGYRIQKADGSGPGRGAGMLLVDEREAPAIRRMFELAAQGLSTIDVAERLDALGLGPRGTGWHGRPPSGRWNFGTVYRRLTDQTYIGRWRYGKEAGTRGRRAMVDEPIVVQVPPIVDEPTFWTVQATLRRNALEATRNAKERYLLRGKVCCEACREPYTGSMAVRRGGTRTRYYRNRYQGRHRRVVDCRHPVIRADFVEERVWADLAEFIDDPEALRRVLAEQTAAAPVDRSAERAQAEQRGQELHQAEVNLMMAFANPAYPMREAAFTEAMATLNNQRRSVEQLLQEIAREEAAVETRHEDLRELEVEFDEYRRWIRNPSWDLKRRAVERFVHELRVSVLPDGRPAVRARYAFQKPAACNSSVDDVMTTNQVHASTLVVARDHAYPALAASRP